ncbi:MAG: pimeloyl-ACP methyl ester carboxylesterase [Candidatus Pseudothioglobus sp.]|jgi:pimeloyl-ACP methyl ester carboxylesterase
MEFQEVKNGEITLRVAVEGEGPLILCVHGWPELWYSWRHQLAYFSERGYQVAAMDVRGYGGSSKPHEISAYTLRELASDVAAVAQALTDGPVILFGHDWGAPVAWTTTLLYPQKIRALALHSVPFRAATDVCVLDVYDAMYKDRFFYQLYFQQEGVAEAEFEGDMLTVLKTIYLALSDGLQSNKPRDATYLQGTTVPTEFPAWMSAADLQVYVDAHSKGGMRGPFNRYRAQRQDTAENEDLRGKKIQQPTCFIAGSLDPVRHFIPGKDLFAIAGVDCDDFRGTTIIDDVGHWVQQQAPDETNAALEKFVRGLD